MTSIDEARARELAAERFNELLSQLYFGEQFDGEPAYYPVPTLGADDFTVVSSDGQDIVLDHAPPAGLYVKMRVSRDGERVELLSLERAPE